MEILENLKLPIEGVVNLSMRMYFFKDRNTDNIREVKIAIDCDLDKEK